MVNHRYFNPNLYQKQLIPLLKAVEKLPANFNDRNLTQLLRQYPKDNHGYFSKTNILKAYRLYAGKYGLKPLRLSIIKKIQMKPIRTLSGVTPITVLTKPYPCPGKCIFCPNDTSMPKSYIASEPGAQRALKCNFDPYLQVYSRLKTYQEIGHPHDKVELIVLGGTWTAYPLSYQIWFISRCFAALNDFSQFKFKSKSNQPLSSNNQKSTISKSKNSLIFYNNVIRQNLTTQPPTTKISSLWSKLFKLHRLNQDAKVRCIGLVLETRPDQLNINTIKNLRLLGATKIQLGVQSLNDSVLLKNRRGHTAQTTKNAISLLRLAGFKIHAHWMPNLYGSSVANDIKDFNQLFSDPSLMPDELKIYPCSLIPHTPLMKFYKSKKWHPYTYSQLLKVISQCLHLCPPYCRISRIVRDIPSNEIFRGNKKSNFRQIAQKYCQNHHLITQDIRSREIRNQSVDLKQLKLNQITYPTSISQEYFLEYVTDNYLIAGFLRLTLPNQKSFISELASSAIIREVHVYGPAVKIGRLSQGKTQHLGLGKKLINQALFIASKNGYSKISVISAIGTRHYYQKLGFTQGKLYQHLSLKSV